MNEKSGCPACDAGIPLKIMIVDSEECSHQLFELTARLRDSVPDIQVALVKEQQLERHMPSKTLELFVSPPVPEESDQSKDALIADTSYRAVKERSKFFNKKRSK